MRIFGRYIHDHLARGFVLVLLVLLTLFSFIDFVDELEETGRGRYGALDAVNFVVLMTPARVLGLVPVTALLGTLFGLGVLQRSNELTAMRAAGVSPLAILAAVVRAGAILLVVVAVLAEFVAPRLAQRAWEQRARALSGDVIAYTEEGGSFWFRDGARFIKVGEMRFGRDPIDIEIYDFDAAGRLHAYIQAHEAEKLAPGRWLLRQVREKRYGEAAVELLRLPTLVWTGFLSPDQGAVTELDVDSLAPSTLYLYAADLRRRGQNAERYEVALWRKLSLPVATMAMLLVAVAFMFGAFGLTGMGQRVFAGAVVGVVFYLADQILAQTGLLVGLNPAWPALVPALLLGACGYWLLLHAASRGRRTGRRRG